MIHVSVIVKSGKNNDVLPYMSSFFQGQTPRSEPAIKPVIIEIVIDLCFFNSELNIFEKKTKPDMEPTVNRTITLRRYSLSGSLMN